MQRRKLFFYGQGSDSQIGPLQLGSLGWDVYAASDVYTAKQLLEHHDFYIGVVFLDCDSAYLAQIEEFLLSQHPMEWIAIVPALERQAPSFGRWIGELFYDFHTLPLDISRLTMTLGHAYGKAVLRHRVVANVDDKGEFGMIGNSSAMRLLYRDLQKIQESDAPVLILGESGTGKELAANAIHHYSKAADGPFIAVNCGSIPAHLVQSELFGHERGSFTGAYKRKIGSIEAAAGGAIFLDEIGDLSLELQVNLLRFLEEKTIQRVGAPDRIRVETRVIAATHVDLEEAVAQGRFREDLYYRINVLQLKVPSLREREDDFELLAQAYFEKFTFNTAIVAKGFSKQAMKAMKNHVWPGNVRELINRVRRAVVMSENRLLTPADLGLEQLESSRQPVKLGAARLKSDQEVIRRALYFTNHNVSEAARQLGVSRVTLYRLMDKMRVEQ